MFERIGHIQYRIVKSFYEGNSLPEYFSVQYREKRALGWGTWWGVKYDLTFEEAENYIKEKQRIQKFKERKFITKVFKTFE